MRIYNSKAAPNARRVRIFLAEKKLDLPMTDVDLGLLEHKTPSYSDINPFQGVPALVLDDGAVIAESVAICRYFEELHPEPPLFGTGARGRAEVEMWQRRLELYLFMPVALAFRHSHPAMRVLESPQLPEWAEVNRARALVGMARFDEALREREFIAGDAYSIADITGLVALDFTRPAKIAIPESLTHLRRWRETLAARPSAAA